MRLTLSAVGQIVTWGCGFAYLFGLPSPLEGKLPKDWVAAMTSTPVVLVLCILGALVTGPGIWLSGWWWPRLSRWIRRVRLRREPAVDTAMDARIEKFKELMPLITRHRKALRPARLSSLPALTITGQVDQRADHNDLVEHLDALAIPHPLEADRSKWHSFLIALEIQCEAGNLQTGSRTLEQRL